MKKSHFTPALLALSVLLSACSSMPTSTSLLDQTRSDYLAAQNNPYVGTYARLEMKQADDAMQQANALASDNGSAEKVDKLAYLAKQKIALTQEVAKQKAAEADIASAGKERDQIRLDQRTNEANRAKMSAEQSKLEAQVAQGEAAEAQRQAAQSRLATSEAERQTQDAQARAAQLEAQLADLAAKKTVRGIIITLGDVLFGTDLARLNADGMRTAQKLAEILQQNPQRTVVVEGFTDSTGSALHNQELSERRAGAVRAALQEFGVSGERVVIRGFGETHPVAANDTPEHRQLNRRVEIVLSDAGVAVAPR
jgi:outer membrane protein OmpA-like peptidoglycan-associated protein